MLYAPLHLDLDGPDGATVALPDRYRLGRLHGSGGGGRVYEVWDRHLQRTVALKIPHRTSLAAAGAAAEVAALSRLNHPNVVRLFDAGVDPATGRVTYFTMPLLGGKTLRDEIQAFHQTSAALASDAAGLRKLVGAVRAVCQALVHAHALNLLHLDLKGVNVRLGGPGEVVVLDWGLARAAGWAGGGSGTPGYQAPEQVAGGWLDARTDIHGVGALLFEALANYPPDGKTWPAGPRALVAIGRRALAARPDDRYQTAAELLADLDRWLSGESVAADPEPLAAWVSRVARRNRRTVVAGAAGLIVAVVALAIGLGVAVRQRAVAEMALAAEQESFRLALDAGGECFAAVADDDLASADGLQPLRLRLAEKGLVHYQALLDRHADDPAVLTEVAAAWVRVGLLQRDLGQGERATESLRRAVPLLEKLTAPAVASPRARLLLPKARTALAFHLAYIWPAEAAAEADRADAEAVAWLPAGSPDRLWTHLMAADARGHAAPDATAAANQFAAAAAAAKQLVAVTNSADHHYLLGVARLQLALRLRQMGRVADARVELGLAENDFALVIRAGADGVSVRQKRAAAVNVGGLLALDAGRPAEAIERFEHAVADRRALAARNPDAPQFQNELAVSLSNLGMALLQSGRPVAAAGPAREGAAAAAVVNDYSVRVCDWDMTGRLYARAGVVAVVLGEWERADAEFTSADSWLARRRPSEILADEHR